MTTTEAYLALKRVTNDSFAITHDTWRYAYGDGSGKLSNRYSVYVAELKDSFSSDTLGDAVAQAVAALSTEDRQLQETTLC